MTAKYMKSRGIRIAEIFFVAKTLKNGNRACVSFATPIFIYIVVSSFFGRGDRMAMV